MTVSVLIGTFNRCRLLAATLDSLAAMRVPPDLWWDVIVVDNNSADATRAAVESRIPAFPVPLRYLFEPQQGKSYAINKGLAASTGSIVAFTDDDVQVDTEWLAAALAPMSTRPEIHYTGGPVLPLWETSPPAWILGDSGVLRGPLALLDYGTAEFVFEDRQRIPVGVNMAVRRSAIDRVGGFHARLDRRGNSLSGQGQAEFFFRTRSAGLRGLYVPGMRVHHHVPAARMTIAYYRRWWYWKGVARAHMEDWHAVSELGLDLRAVPRLLDVPRFMWRSAIEDTVGWAGAILSGQERRRVEREAGLAYFAGYLAGRRNRGIAETAENPGDRAFAAAASAAAAGLQSRIREL